VPNINNFKINKKKSDLFSSKILVLIAYLIVSTLFVLDNNFYNITTIEYNESAEFYSTELK